MLTILISPHEYYDPVKNEFINVQYNGIIEMEHSLHAISEWESTWCKNFIGRKDCTREEMIDYFRCMTLTQNVDPNVFRTLSDKTISKINAYIDSPRSATKIKRKNNRPVNNGKFVSSEEIYSWMVENGIPFTCDKWNFNRLMNLIEICSIRNNPSKKGKGLNPIDRYEKILANRRHFNTRG